MKGLNDLYDTICMTHNSQSVFRFSLCIHFHTSFSYRVVVRTEYSAFPSFSKMSQKQAAAALVSKKNKSRKKAQKVGMKPWLKRGEKLGFY